MDSPTIEDARDDIRVTGSLDALAEFTGDPWLRGKRVRLDSDERNMQARTSVLLMRVWLHEDRLDVLIAVIRELHFDGKHVEMQERLARETRSGVSKATFEQANELATWICADPQRKARALDRLREAIARVKII
jgi:hypothetical protein